MADAAQPVIDRIHGAVLKADDRMDRDLKVATRTIEVVEKEVRKAEAQSGRRKRIAIDEALQEAAHQKETVLIAVRRVAAHKAVTNEAAIRHEVQARIDHSKVVRAKVEARQLVVDEAAMIADQAAEAEEARRSHIVDPARADLRGCNEDRSVVHNPVADLHSVADHHSDAVDLVVRRWAHRG